MLLKEDAKRIFIRDRRKAKISTISYDDNVSQLQDDLELTDTLLKMNALSCSKNIIRSMPQFLSFNDITTNSTNAHEHYYS